MTDFSWLLFATAGVVAGGDWLAVVRRSKPLEYACKPAVLVFLIAVALSLEPRLEAQRWAFVVALALSLVGDVLLMLDRFVQGLVAFFAAHLAYIVGLRVGRFDVTPLLVSALVVAVAAAILGRRILIGVRRSEPAMVRPVSAYIAAIAVMVASALASGNPFAATAGALFLASDTLIAWNRFVQPLGWAPITIIVTYHLAQAGFVLSLAL